MGHERTKVNLQKTEKCLKNIFHNFFVNIEFRRNVELTRLCFHLIMQKKVRLKRKKKFWTLVMLCSPSILSIVVLFRVCAEDHFFLCFWWMIRMKNIRDGKKILYLDFFQGYNKDTLFSSAVQYTHILKQEGTAKTLNCLL